MYKIIGLAFDGCQASGLTAPFDVFNVVNSTWRHQREEDSDLYHCSLITHNGEPFQCSNGMRMMADYSLADAPKPDLILIPGIHHLNSRSLLTNLKNLNKELTWLQQQIDQGVPVAANCSGVFMLAETGVLDNRDATTSWWLGGLFRKRYPQVNHIADRLLTEDGNTYTTGSMSANIGVMLKVVEQQVGRQLAQSAAKTMLIDASQSYASPYLFMQEQTEHQDSLVLAVESQLQRDIAKKINLEELATKHAVSVRTLSRRFKKANGVGLSDYLQRLRLEQTKLLLETTSLTIEQIVERVGYSSQSSLRRLFQKELGLSPREYRNQFLERSKETG